MKTIQAFLFLMAFTSTFSQTDFRSLSAKELKKVSKKLDLSLVNRGFDGVGKVYVNGENVVHDLWREVMFEVNVPIGYETGEEEGTIIVDASWVIDLDSGGYSGQIKDLSNDLAVVCTFKTKQKMNIYRKNTSRADEFKLYVKVILKQIYDSI